MNVLLIVPRYSFENYAFYEYPFPVGLSYIAAVIKKSGNFLKAINLNHFSGKTDIIIENELNKQNYDIVCSGSNARGYHYMDEIIKVCRKHKTNPIVIIGGPIITTEPELIFKSLRPDIGVIGEGEEIIVEILEWTKTKNQKTLEKINGIIFVDKEKNIRITEKRKIISNLNLIPFPDFESLDYMTYLKNLSSSADFCNNPFDHPRTYSLICSRSCPFQCTFCYHDGYYRQRSLDNVFEEIEYAIKKYQINSINIFDDCFAINKERFVEFCQRIQKIRNNLNYELKWMCQLTVKSADFDTLKLLKQSGCNTVSLGFESYSPEVLKSMKKPITPEMIDSAFKNAMKLGITVGGNFIFGDVAETIETSNITLDYWKNECLGQLGLSFIQPYPGSEIYKHCLEKGIITDKLDFIKNKLSTSVAFWYNMTDKMSDEEIKKLRKDVLDAQAKYCKFIVPDKMKKDNNPRCYKIIVTCPFCNKKIIYKNFRIIKKYWFFFGIGSATVCRNCNKRFFIVSRIEKFAYKNYVSVRKIRDFLERLRINIKKKNV